MAINDNETYGLKGSQVKDLASRIKTADAKVKTNAGAPTTSTVGTLGQLLEDTTNGKLYICTAVVPGTEPDPDTYTWEEVGTGTLPIATTSTLGVVKVPSNSQLVVDANGNLGARVQRVLHFGENLAPGSDLPNDWITNYGTGFFMVDYWQDVLTDQPDRNGILISRQTGNSTSGGKVYQVFMAAEAGGKIWVRTGNPQDAYWSSPWHIDSGTTYGWGAPTTSTVGEKGLIYRDTTNGDAYICIDIVAGTDPDPDTYIWRKVNDPGMVMSRIVLPNLTTSATGMNTSNSTVQNYLVAAANDAIAALDSGVYKSYVSVYGSGTTNEGSICEVPYYPAIFSAVGADGTQQFSFWTRNIDLTEHTTAYSVTKYKSYRRKYSFYILPSELAAKHITHVYASYSGNDPDDPASYSDGLITIVNEKEFDMYAGGDFLSTTNTASYTPTGDYNPATKKYVDDTAPSIQMSSTDPGEGSVLAENNYIAVYGTNDVNFDYSINEVDTGTLWYTGEHIYRKTFVCGALPNNGAKTVPLNINNFSKLIKLEGIAIKTDGVSFPLPYSSIQNVANSVEVGLDNSGRILIETGKDRSSFTESYITLYYTKSS